MGAYGKLAQPLRTETEYLQELSPRRPRGMTVIPTSCLFVSHISKPHNLIYPHCALAKSAVGVSVVDHQDLTPHVGDVECGVTSLCCEQRSKTIVCGPRTKGVPGFPGLGAIQRSMRMCEALGKQD